MSAKRSSRRKTKKSSNSLFIFIAIVIVLAILSLTISYFFTEIEETDKPAGEINKTMTLDKTTDDDTITPLEGTWVSNYDGTMLTITGLSFILESPSVESSSKISGKLSAEENIVTFTNAENSKACANTEGHYLYTLEDNGDLVFKLIKDKCESRKERMTAGWFKI